MAGKRELHPPGARGLWFEDFEPGQVFESPGRTLTETDVVLFAGLSGDVTSLHTDEEFAKRTPFRRRIAHGLLVSSIATGLAARTGIFEGTIVALPAMDIRWTNPAFPGDTLRLRLEVTRKEEEPSRRSGRVYFQASVQNQKDQVISESSWEIVVLRDRERLDGATRRGERQAP
jgi:acyl dehydratase